MPAGTITASPTFSVTGAWSPSVYSTSPAVTISLMTCARPSRIASAFAHAAASVAAMIGRKDTLKVGDVVAVTGSRAKNPESLNVGQATITAAGRRIFAGVGPAGVATAEP